MPHWQTGDLGDSKNGCFINRAKGMVVVASSGEGWDHVSVSFRDRCPTWDEMEDVRRDFFSPTDTVIQIHPPLADYVNLCKNCLHLWRPWHSEIPLPPREFVG